MNVAHVVRALEEIAPPALAETWDNVGLLVGSTRARVQRALLTIDLTAAVLDEARATRARLVIAYHPLIFEPLRAVTDASEKGAITLAAARAGIAVYSPHTALDAAPGGVNDWLADGCGHGQATPLVPHASLPSSETHKLVTFCPAGAADRIRDALATAGAGRIGNYARCSFEIPGTGTFEGSARARPAVGKTGRLERVEERRLEMVCAEGDLGAVVTALRATHPYEEPPIELYALVPRPDPGRGAGRRVVLAKPVTLKPLVARLKAHLGVRTLAVAPGADGSPRISTIGLCPGAGGSLLAPALAAGCDLFLTGEMRHHDVLSAQAAGCTVVLAGHTNTERGYLKTLRTRLRCVLPTLEITISKNDRDPLRTM